MSFVEAVPVFATGVYAPIEDIQETIDYTRLYADQQRDILNTAIDNLADIIGQYEPSFGIVSSDIKELLIPPFPAKPSLNPDLNEDWPSTGDIPDPIIRDIAPDFSTEEPVPPDSIDPSFDYTPGAYISCIWDELCTQIKNELVNGGNGLSNLVYSLILDRNAEARRNAEEQARRRAYNAVGARGFDLAGGMAAAVILELEREILAKDLDAINSTTIKDFEMADANARFIKELALKIEEVQRAAFESEEARLFEIAKVSEEMIIAIFEQNVKIYIAKWEGVKIKLEAIKLEVEAIIAYNDGQIKIFVSRIEAIKSEIQAIAAENSSKTEVTKAQASVYETEVKAVGIQVTALVEEVRVSMEEYKIKVDESIEKEKVNLSAYTSSADLAARVTESIANIASQSVASALSAIKTSMDVGYSGSESQRYSASVNSQLSESHRYEEK